jgi:hypothetical protein
MATITVKQNICTEMRGPTGLSQSRKTQTSHPTCVEEKCYFGFNIMCSSLEGQYGAWFLSKSGSGREHVEYPQDLNFVEQCHHDRFRDKKTNTELFQNQRHSKLCNETGPSHDWEEIFWQTDGTHLRQGL